MNIFVPIITIDGPGGTGKGTISLLLAKHLGWHFLDSGVLYRALAWWALQKQIDLHNEMLLAELARHLPIRFVEKIEEKRVQLFIDQQDVSEALRTESCGAIASKISAFPAVRTALLERQRAFRQPPGLVADGRDMGTVIFPDAVLKIFLVASQEERARRRYNQLKKQAINVSLRDVLQDLQARDERDQNRVVAPLKPAADAVVIDTTTLTVEQVFTQVLQLAENKLAK